MVFNFPELKFWKSDAVNIFYSGIHGIFVYKHKRSLIKHVHLLNPNIIKHRIDGMNDE